MTCQKGDVSRRVHVVIENTDTGLPCEVISQSPATEPKRLWRAEFEQGFCEQKLEALVARLTDDQWLCLPSDLLNTDTRQQRWRPVM